MTSFPLRQRQAVGVSSLPLGLPYWMEGKPPVQCSNLDLCIFLDREPFIHTSCTHTVAGVLTLRRLSSRRLFLLFLWNCHTGSWGWEPPVQCSYFDLCIFLDREPFIHTMMPSHCCRGLDALPGVDVMPRPLAL